MKKVKNTLFSNKPVTIDENSLIMAIESSCDETACAIVKGGREVLANVVASQIKIHEEYGGVIPEIAALDKKLMISPTVALGEVNVVTISMAKIAKANIAITNNLPTDFLSFQISKRPSPFDFI